MVQYTPVTMNDVMELVLPVFPDTVSPLIRSVIVQVYTKSNGFIPFTLLVALWSAGKGVLSVTYGLNCIYDNIETRNYFYLRFRACFYTVLFLIAIMLSLVLSVFGNSLSAVVYEHIPFMSKVMNFIIRIRTCLTLVVLTFFFHHLLLSAQQGRIFLRLIFSTKKPRPPKGRGILLAVPPCFLQHLSQALVLV
jgi:membrane protein